MLDCCTFRNFFKGDCRLGQLTLKGFRQEEALGRMFRDTYVPRLVDGVIDPSQVATPSSTYII